MSMGTGNKLVLRFYETPVPHAKRDLKMKG